MMTTGMRRLARLGLVLALAGFCVQALAQDAVPRPDRRMRERAPRHHGGPGGDWWNNPRTVEALGLSDATRSQIQDEVHETRLNMIDLKADVERENLQLERMMQDPDPSMPQIEDQVDRFVKAQGSVMREEILLRARIRNLLTPEQRAELETLHRNRRDQMRRDFMERRRPPTAPEPSEEPAPPQ